MTRLPRQPGPLEVMLMVLLVVCAAAFVWSIGHCIVEGCP